jgi:outer membrane protein
MRFPSPNKKSPHTAAFAILLSLCATQARADDSNYKNEWSGIVGAGVGVIPEYVGSSHTKSELQPLLKISDGRFFAGGEAGLGVGYNAFELGDMTFGAFLTQALDAPRDESDDPHLRCLGNVDATTRAALFATYNHDWLRATANVSWDIGGNREGALAKLSADAVLHPTPKLELFAGPQLIFGNTQYEQTLFGVNANQSNPSGLPVYTPKSGLSQASLELGANYALSKNWVASTRVVAGRLEGDSANSPIVEKKVQDTFGIYLAYKF